MRDAEHTRQKILDITADEIHKHGFTATSLSVIIKRCEISKGALYHHFTNKMELGYAVFEEVFTPMFLASWQPAIEGSDPIEGLCDFFSEMTSSMSCEDFLCGCPLHNLCQEMSAIDEGFRVRILDMQTQLNTLLAQSLEKVSPQLRNDIDYSQVCYFIVASFNGAMSFSKSAKDKALFDTIIEELCRYIRALRRR